MLAAVEVPAVALRDLCSQDTDDITILGMLRAGHDVFITYDHRQKTREAEARAIRRSSVTALWIGRFWGKLRGLQQAAWLMSRWETIDHFASSCTPGTCAEVQRNGRAKPISL